MYPNNPSPGPHGPVPQQIHYAPPRSKGTGAGKSCLIAIGVAFGLLVLLGACAALLGSGPTKTTSSTQPPATTTSPSSPANAAQPTTKKAPVNGIGQEYRDGKFAFTVTKIQKGVQRVGDQYVGQTAQGQFVLISVTVHNIGNEARMFDSSSQKLTDVQGRNFDADSGATIAMGEQSNAFLNNINPGNGVDGILIFDVPQSVKLKSLELHDSPFSGGVTVPIPS